MINQPTFITVNQPLAPLSGYQCGGRAKYYLETSRIDELQAALSWSQQVGLEVFFLGSGTNVLFPDGDLNMLVIRWSKMGIEINSANELVVGAGEELQSVVNFALNNDIVGYSWAAGLPGTVGAAVRGNVGAFGQELSDVFIKTRYLDIEHPHQLQEYSLNEMNFEYRSSTVKTTGVLVLDAWLKITRGNQAEMDLQKEKAEDHLAFRNQRHPLQFPNCGSVFKNINDPQTVEALITQWPDWEEMVSQRWYGKIPAAAIIEAVGLKAVSCGGASISEQHANFIVNRKAATSTDVYDLICLVQEKVANRFGVELEPEIKILGP